MDNVRGEKYGYKKGKAQENTKVVSKWEVASFLLIQKLSYYKSLTVIAQAASNMIIYKSHSLHIGINDGGANKGHAAFL